jgi:uncharacterized protein (UPF0335 family)
MQNMLKLALGAVLATTLVAPAMAQENFPDVPANHWAYEALRNLKDKVLFGYPDGLYRGNRPMSRYEFAVAVNQLHQLLAGRISALEGQVKSLEDMIKNRPGGTDTAGLQGLRDQLSALTKRVDGLESGHAELKKLIDEFKKELAALGVDVDAMKKDIADLESRVSALEKIKPAVTLSGDVNFLVLGGYSTDGNFGLAQSGQTTGRGRVAPFGTVGADKDLSVLHEAAISMTSTNETGPKFKGTFVLGNMLGSIGNDLSGMTNTANFIEGPSDIYINELYVSFDHSLFGQGFSATVGRFGHKNLDYVFARPDNTIYYANDRWDNGKIILDGLAVGLGIGSAHLNVFGGRTGGNGDNAVSSFNQGYALTPALNRILGADVNVKAGPVDLAAAYIIMDSDTLIAPGTNRAESFGADAKFKVAGLDAGVGVAKGHMNFNDKSVNTKDMLALYGTLAYSQDRWGVSGGYRDIDANFFNPGNWGAIGTVTNPNGIKGFHGKVWFKASDALKLHATGQFYEGQLASGAAGNLGLTANDDIQSVVFGADFKLSDVFAIDAAYEDVVWKLNNAPDPYQRWFTLGFNWTMSEKAMMRLFWQYSDANDKGTNAFVNVLGLGAGRFKGGLIGTQVSIKF